MKLISVREAAEHLGVGEQRVRDRLSSGDLEGEKVSGVWLVDPASLPHSRHGAGRPFSQRIAWALIEGTEGERPPGVSPSEMSRLRRKWNDSVLATDPIAHLKPRMASRAKRLRWLAPEPDELLQDDRFVPSGRSDPRSGMSGGAFAEGYVCTRDLADLAADHLLVKPPLGSRENVVTYATDHLPSAPVPWLLVALDLADGGPRELQQASLVYWSCLSGKHSDGEGDVQLRADLARVWRWKKGKKEAVGADPVDEP